MKKSLCFLFLLTATLEVASHAMMPEPDPDFPMAAKVLAERYNHYLQKHRQKNGKAHTRAIDEEMRLLNNQNPDHVWQTIFDKFQKVQEGITTLNRQAQQGGDGPITRDILAANTIKYAQALLDLSDQAHEGSSYFKESPEIFKFFNQTAGQIAQAGIQRLLQLSQNVPILRDSLETMISDAVHQAFVYFEQAENVQSMLHIFFLFTQNNNFSPNAAGVRYSTSIADLLNRQGNEAQAWAVIEVAESIASRAPSVPKHIRYYLQGLKADVAGKVEAASHQAIDFDHQRHLWQLLVDNLSGLLTPDALTKASLFLTPQNLDGQTEGVTVPSDQPQKDTTPEKEAKGHANDQEEEKTGPIPEPKATLKKDMTPDPFPSSTAAALVSAQADPTLDPKAQTAQRHTMLFGPSDQDTVVQERAYQEYQSAQEEMRLNAIRAELQENPEPQHTTHQDDNAAE